MGGGGTGGGGAGCLLKNDGAEFCSGHSGFRV